MHTLSQNVCSLNSSENKMLHFSIAKKSVVYNFKRFSAEMRSLRKLTWGYGKGDNKRFVANLQGLWLNGFYCQASIID